MLGWILGLSLALAPLPQLPWIPHGSELRLTSPDYRTVYAVYQVRQRRLVAPSKPIPVAVSKALRLIIRTPDRIHVYNGLSASRGDVWLQVREHKLSLNELLTRTYRLELPGGRVLPEVR